MTAETDESFAKWVRWATRQADKLDPLAPGFFCTLEDKRRTTFQDHEKVPGVVELIWRRMVKRSRHVEKSEVWWGNPVALMMLNQSAQASCVVDIAQTSQLRLGAR